MTKMIKCRRIRDEFFIVQTPNRKYHIARARCDTHYVSNLYDYLFDFLNVRLMTFATPPLTIDELVKELKDNLEWSEPSVYSYGGPDV